MQTAPATPNASQRQPLADMPPEWREMALVFIALGDEHRQRILLSFTRGQRMNAGQVAAASTLSRPAVSHHLKVLRQAGVLVAEKEGREIWYSVNRAPLEHTLSTVLDYVRENA